MSTINERIAQCITELGLTKTAFAKRVNLSQPHISKIALGHSAPSDRTITDICREFNISDTWLRTGEGEMFIQKSRTDEIMAFTGDILRGEPDFRQKFVSVLARMTAEEWKVIEAKALELAEEIKKADP